MENADLKNAMMVAMCPAALEKHLNVNVAQFKTDDDIYHEIVRYVGEVGKVENIKANAMEVDHIENLTDDMHDHDCAEHATDDYSDNSKDLGALGNGGGKGGKRKGSNN